MPVVKFVCENCECQTYVDYEAYIKFIEPVKLRCKYCEYFFFSSDDEEE